MADIYTVPSTNGPTVTTNIVRKRHASTGILRTRLNTVEESAQASWGRISTQSSWVSYFISGTWVFFAPLASVSAFIAMNQFDGSLMQFCSAVAEDGFLKVLTTYGPAFSVKGAIAWLGWIMLQVALYLYLPGSVHQGQPTPAGHVLSYNINGLHAWTATLVIYGALSGAGIIDPAFVPKNWSGLVAAMNVTGIALSVFALVKAYIAPTHPNDRKFSGCTLFDLYMGIEMNPRVGSNFDFKLFNNGRPGMIAWTLIDLSNLAYQYQQFQSVSISLILVTIFHSLYIVDFFVNEAWYLRTIDIAHDHFGFYLAWGTHCWLPTMYTLQAQYLGRMDPATDPSSVYLAATTLLGLLGYALFREVNNQKDLSRSTEGKCTIWGRPAEYIKASYLTSDGVEHKTILLCSGWWGCARHVNYVGDLMLSSAICAHAGVLNPLVWFYAIYMTVLLVHRCLRDEERGKSKYGATWDEYCERVPWRLIPSIW